MKLTLVTVRQGGAKLSSMAALTEEYLMRCAKVMPATWVRVKTSAEALKLTERSASALILFDSRGKMATSEEFAATLAGWRDNGKREAILAIGPADGWSDAERSKADLLLSLGKMTLPHELAALVTAEQMYRACAIASGHPYHSGH